MKNGTASKPEDKTPWIKLEKRGRVPGQLSKEELSQSKGRKVESYASGSKKTFDEWKAAALWTNKKEGVNGRSWKHTGTLGRCVATSTNKWQPKRWKTHNKKTPNVNQGSKTWTQGAKQKVKKLPSMFKIWAFSLVVKNNQNKNWWKNGLNKINWNWICGSEISIVIEDIASK